MPAVIFILETINSVRDVNGNTYWAYRITHCPTGATYQATHPTTGSGLVDSALFQVHKGLRWGQVHQYKTVLKRSEFRKLVKGWTCPDTSAKIAAALVEAIAEASPTMLY